MNMDHRTLHHRGNSNDNDNKKVLDLSIRDKVQPYLCCKKNGHVQTNAIPALKEKCLDTIKSNAHLLQQLFSEFDGLSLSNDDFLNDLPLDIQATYIHQEDFYKDMMKKISAKEHFVRPLSAGHHSWKRMYLEHMLMNMLSEAKDAAIPTMLAELFQDYIFSLELNNFSNFHFLESTLPQLSNLATLEIEYGHKPNFDDPHQTQERNLFGGMKIAEAQSLARGLHSVSHLCSLKLTNSLIGDDVICSIFEEYNGSSVRDTLVELDLSYNKIHADGFRRILEYFFSPLDGTDEDKDDITLKSNSFHHKKQETSAMLVTLKVAGNYMQEEGARIFGKILQTNNSLEELDLRMNALNDEGGSWLMEGLCTNKTLKKLNLACNNLSTKTANRFCSLVDKSSASYAKYPPSLQSIDLSSNMFSEADMNRIARTCISKSSNFLLALDLGTSNYFGTETGMKDINSVKDASLVPIKVKLTSNGVVRRD